MNHHYIPFFQPIFSIEEQSIFGYEVLARILLNGEYRLPNVFLNHRSGENPEFLEADTTIQKKAFQKLYTNPNTFLFINLSPDEILRQMEESQGDNLLIASLTKEAGIPNNKVFLEITETPTHRDPEILGTAVEYFRELGFRIAMDDVGSESSNLERIAIIQPEIIKVDLVLLKKSIHDRNFHSVLEYLSQIATSIGSDLLFEGIESQQELYRALDFGARYLQGYLLGYPSIEFSSEPHHPELLKKLFDQFHEFKRSTILNEIQFEEKIIQIISNNEPKIKLINNMVHINVQEIFQLSPYIQRIYATDWEGTQLSPYYERNGEKGFTQNSSSLYKNWSYMPFFYKHVKKCLQNPKTWNASEPYFDKKLQKNLIVLSKVTTDHLSIFIDIEVPNEII